MIREREKEYFETGTYPVPTEECVPDEINY